MADDLFGGHAALYASVRPSYPPELIDWVAAQCQNRSRALDVATGNGQAARDLAEHFDDVVAIDVSDAQLREAKPHPRIRYAVASAESTGLADRSVDLVAAAQALHWFENAAFSAELTRVLRPGGVFAAWGYAFFHIDDDVDSVLRLAVLDVIEPYWPARSRVLWDGWTSVTLPGTPIETPSFEMNEVVTLDSLWKFMSSWSGWQRAVAAGVAVDAGRELVEEVWGDGSPRTKRTPLIFRATRLG